MKYLKNIAVVGTVIIAGTVHNSYAQHNSVLDKISSSSIAAKDEWQQLNDIRYKAPKGWQNVPQQNDMRLYISPNSTSEKQAMVFIVQTAPLQTTFRAAFDNALKSSTQNMKLTAPEVKQDRTAEGNYDMLARAFSAEDNSGNKLFGAFIAMNVNNKMVLAGQMATTKEIFSQYQKEMMQFVADIKLPGENKKPVSTDPQKIQFKSPEEAGRDEDARRKPNIVAGNIYDAQGRPFKIPGASVVVHIWGAGSNGDRIGFNIQMDANGHYESQVPGGLYGFHARALMLLNGQRIGADLEPLDGRPTNIAVHSAPGIVKDFALRLTGPVAGGDPNTLQGYYGGKVTVTDGANWNEPIFGAMSAKYPKGAKVVLTLTPLSPLIDGSQGSTIILDCNLEFMQTGHNHANIPLAVYRATTVLVFPDGRQTRLKIATLPKKDYNDYVDIFFEPNRDDVDGTPVTPNIMVLD